MSRVYATNWSLTVTIFIVIHNTGQLLSEVLLSGDRAESSSWSSPSIPSTLPVVDDANRALSSVDDKPLSRVCLPQESHNFQADRSPTLLGQAFCIHFPTW